MKIFIDAGHNYSGADTGTEGNGLREQDVTYKVAEKLSTLLKLVGIEIKMSRNNITDNIGTTLTESINNRARLANGFGADYFISLHCDASSYSTAKGSHICVYKKGGVAETLANCINPYLLALGLEGRTEIIKERTDLGVLKNTNMPAILIEMGFMTNPQNSELQKKPDKLAEAIFKGVCEFLGISIQETKEYVAVTDAISILVRKGIITDAEKWYNGTWTDEDFKWLLRKVGTYLNEH